MADPIRAIFGEEMNRSVASAITAAANYTVTASNSAGSTTAVVNIAVIAAVPAVPSGLVYSTNPAVYIQGTAIANNNPSNFGGAVTSYAVAPLPTGLSLNSTTGVISGTPSVTAPAADYIVTAMNSGGSTTAAVNITVNGAPSGPLTIFGSSRPTSMAQATQSIELGLKFSADVAGSVTGVRFYKDVNNTGTRYLF